MPNQIAGPPQASYSRLTNSSTATVCEQANGGQGVLTIMLSLPRVEATWRGTWTCLSCSNICVGSQSRMVTLSYPLIARSHQRRNSSSKPFSPPKNIARAIDTPSKALSTESSASTKPTAEKRSSTRPSRRKTKDITPLNPGKAKDGNFLNVPSVPSTQHLHPQGRFSKNQKFPSQRRLKAADIHVASFFSIHRPISVTSSVPASSTPSIFSSIFAKRASPKHGPSQVMYTISSAVDSLESSAASPPQQIQQIAPEETDLQSVMSQPEYFNDDAMDTTRYDPSQPEVIHLNIQELVKNFRPFAPPPPPVAQDAVEESSRQASRKRLPTQKSFSAVLTIIERTNADGRKSYETRTCSIREDPEPIDDAGSPAVENPPAIRQPFLNHMRERQRRWEEFRRENAGGEAWRLISVRRQRKLKMKKHKYKKLMRKTRNLRRRLDRV